MRDRQKIAITSDATVMSKPPLHRKAVGGPADPGDDLAQLPVVDIHHPAPGNPAQVQPNLVAPVNVVVDHRGEQVVGRADRVHVTGKMQVDILHRNHLGVATARGPALEAETGTQARFAQAD